MRQSRFLRKPILGFDKSSLFYKEYLVSQDLAELTKPLKDAINTWSLAITLKYIVYII